MENSKKLQRKQTTQYRGLFAEVEMEARGKQRALSNDLALTKREGVNNVLDDTSNLLDCKKIGIIKSKLKKRRSFKNRL